MSADFAVYSRESPVVDGKLDDAVWRKSAVHSRFYNYVSNRDRLSQLRSEMRLIWNERGLYLGLAHFDPHARFLAHG